MSHDDATHGPAPLSPADPAPMHAAVDALAAALHEYVQTAVGVRAEFGAAEADEDPRVLALEGRIGTLNARLFDALHDSLGLHPDLTSSVWEPDDDAADADSAPEPETAEVFYLGFVVTPPAGTSDVGLDEVIALLDESGGQVVTRLADAGFGVAEWAASRGEAAEFEGFDDDTGEAP